jgi:hypothetical protein
MNDSLLETAGLFLVFDRLETTRVVFDQIRKTRPRELFVAADRPRNQVAYLHVESGDFYRTGRAGFRRDCSLLVDGSWTVK